MLRGGKKGRGRETETERQREEEGREKGVSVEGCRREVLRSTSG